MKNLVLQTRKTTAAEIVIKMDISASSMETNILEKIARFSPHPPVIYKLLCILKDKRTKGRKQRSWETLIWNYLNLT